MPAKTLRRLALLLALAAACGDRASSGAGTGAPLDGSCPAGFTPQPGFNEGFPSDGVQRQFHVLLPDALDEPRPLMVSLTGTVQEELSFAAQSGLDQLPAQGWIVAAPVRTCSQNGTNCAQIGSDGRIWEPWYDGTIAGPSDDEGPDVRFVEAMVRCIASRWPVDERRIYAGGISAGGSFTNRNMTFNSDLFAGGVPASGNWYGGLAAPRSPVAMDSSIVVLIWGGPNDVWPPGNPIADYDPETRLAARYYAAQPSVVTVACSGSHGHIWPSAMTPWLVETLLSHPKGADPADFVLTEPPPGFGCVVGAYTDH
ncbi:MAG: PHB depolymerase family esterase [Thermodesulfobacteriota bacterium]